MAKDKKEKPVLNLDDKEYVIEDMTDEQKMMVNHINDLQNKQNTNQFMADQLAVGKEAFINMLRTSLESEEEVEAEAGSFVGVLKVTMLFFIRTISQVCPRL